MLSQGWYADASASATIPPTATVTATATNTPAGTASPCGMATALTYSNGMFHVTLTSATSNCWYEIRVLNYGNVGPFRAGQNPAASFTNGTYTAYVWAVVEGTEGWHQIGGPFVFTVGSTVATATPASGTATATATNTPAGTPTPSGSLPICVFTNALSPEMPDHTNWRQFYVWCLNVADGYYPVVFGDGSTFDVYIEGGIGKVFGETAHGFTHDFPCETGGKSKTYTPIVTIGGYVFSTQVTTDFQCAAWMLYLPIVAKQQTGTPAPTPEVCSDFKITTRHLIDGVSNDGRWVCKNTALVAVNWSNAEDAWFQVTELQTGKQMLQFPKIQPGYQFSLSGFTCGYDYVVVVQTAGPESCNAGVIRHYDPAAQ